MSDPLPTPVSSRLPEDPDVAELDGIYTRLRRGETRAVRERLDTHESTHSRIQQLLLDSAAGTGSITESLEEISYVQDIIRERMRQDESVLYRTYSSLRDTMLGLLGRAPECFTSQQLFERQVTNLRRLNCQLERYGRRAERTLQDLHEYNEDIAAQCSADASRYLRLCSELETALEGQAGGKREIQRVLHEKTLVGQRIIFRKREGDLLLNYEDILSSVQQYCSLVQQNVEMVLEHVEHTKRIHDEFGQQSDLVQHLLDATTILGNYLGALNSTIATTSLEIGSQVRSRGAAFPSAVGMSLEGAVRDVLLGDVSHHQEVDMLVREIIGADHGQA